MLKKLLNPFGLKITDMKPLYMWTGVITAAVLHVAFYATLVHFIIKFW